MTEPTWLPIPGSDGYEASTDGRIRSVSRVVYRKDGKSQPVKGRELKTWVTRGYRAIKLGVHGRHTYVHTLVCEAFHGPRPSPKHEVRHLNGDNFDNRAENLAWGTRSENKQDSIRHGTFWARKKTSCPRGHPYDIVRQREGEYRERRCSICDREHNRKHVAKYRAKRRSRLSPIGRSGVRASAGKSAPVLGHLSEEGDQRG